MARDPGRLRRPGSGSSPVDQLEVWRNWRHDTVEFPAVPGAVVDDEARVGRPRRSRPRIGVVVGATLLFAALALSGLVALGVGPVAHLVGSGDDTHPRHGRATPSPATPSGAVSGATASAGSAASTGSSASTTAPPGVSTRPAGPVPSAAGPPGAGARPSPAGPAGRRGSPPQPPVGGPAG